MSELNTRIYTVCYADPPWPQKKGGLRKSRPLQTRELDYPTIGIPEIGSIIHRVAAPVLFLWTIDKFLIRAQVMAEGMGYNLHARFVWDKGNGISPAFTVRFSHEYLLWMYRKPFTPIDSSMRGRFSTVIREKSTGHSRKPVAARSMIEALYPGVARIELFARESPAGWDVFGNEVESSVDLSARNLDAIG